MPCGISTDNFVRRNIPHNVRIRGQYRTGFNSHATHDGHVASNPNVVADANVTVGLWVPRAIT
jgi:hypothetical protein